MEELFDQRKIVTSQLKRYISETGYNKYSFANECKISPFDLDDILKGKLDDRTEFDRNMKIILDATHLSPDEMLSSQHFVPQKSRGRKVFDVVTDIIDFIYSFLS